MIKIPYKTIAIRFVFGTVFTLFCIIFLGIGFFVLQGKKIINEDGANLYTQAESQSTSISTSTPQFPLGVNPFKKEIVENPTVTTFFDDHISLNNGQSGVHTSWLGKAIARLALMSWYQNLASISSRILVIESGERKEQVAEHFTKILGWTPQEEEDFLQSIETTAPELTDGKFFPGTYSVARGASPDVIVPLITDRFRNEVLARYGAGIEVVVPLNDALTIASLLEREAYDFEDMRLIAGVIWNRLFIGMNLQIDATLQYAKGSKPNEPWWPQVVPNDKYIASVYNTYKNAGLPPAPIANPSLDSILAALNPRKTDCMYYFHDQHAGFHCSKTYEEHVALLKQYYGQGK